MSEKPAAPRLLYYVKRKFISDTDNAWISDVLYRSEKEKRGGRQRVHAITAMTDIVSRYNDV